MVKLEDVIGRRRSGDKKTKLITIRTTREIRDFMRKNSISPTKVFNVALAEVKGQK